MASVRTSDVIIIGAGIAGASAAAFISEGRSVALLEMEQRPGYHSTGRSAANYEPAFGPPVIRALTRASGRFFREPPEGFAHVPLIGPRGALMLCFEGDDEIAAATLALGYRKGDRAEALARVPLLTAREATAYLFDDSLFDADVDALHQGFLRWHRRNGGTLWARAGVTAARRNAGAWELETEAGPFAAPIVAIAAGAWSEPVAALFGCRLVGLVPKRRSAAIIPAPAAESASWPQLCDARDTFYCKPTGGHMMISPVDADPVEPHDAWADDLKIATAIDAFQRVVACEVTRVERTWGGLRTFAPDGEPVIGFDPAVEGVFWLAGQGGYGIQTAPALGTLAAALVLGRAMPPEIEAEGVDVAALSPARFV